MAKMTAVLMNRLDSSASDFERRLDALLDLGRDDFRLVAATVEQILSEVRRRGDAALIEFTNRFDNRSVSTMSELTVQPRALAAAVDGIDSELRGALQSAATRIRAFHERQRAQTWTFREDDGSLLGQRVTALERIGVYVPGGKAAYPSSVLMNVIPAKVAGVDEIILTVPAPGGALDEVVLAAAGIAGVSRVFTIGGAQAIAALAYGTQSIPAVDKIVGPGNAYVATAKAMVFGTVGIDMIAGPSEIVIVCDGRTNPEWVAMDLFSQAEHDERAQAVLLCPDEGFLDAVASTIRERLQSLERSDVIAASLRDRGALIKVRDLGEAIDIVNRLAPEHLELSVEEPFALLDRVRHAGAIFLGRHTSEVLGDYCAGPNHVLPTGRTARFSSPLGVYDFQKRSSLIMSTPQAARTLGRTASMLARREGLTAHARAAELRMDEPDPVAGERKT
jgi:histidinol dehydrogenase